MPVDIQSALSRRSQKPLNQPSEPSSRTLDDRPGKDPQADHPNGVMTAHPAERQPRGMSDTRSVANTLDIQGWGCYSVIAVSFDDDDNAYSALTRLKELDSQHQVGIEEAVVIVREPDGHVVEKDRIAAFALPNTLGGGLVGLLVGIIGGPLGMLIGGTAGLVVGSLFDIDDTDHTDSALAAISSSVRRGHTALLAVVTEQSPEIIDAAMSTLGGTVLRRSVDDVEAETAARRKAERKATREAHKELLRARRKHDQGSSGPDRHAA
jgi:uncharacterized membrane protein